jgi:hypothetical protein
MQETADRSLVWRKEEARKEKDKKSAKGKKGQCQPDPNERHPAIPPFDYLGSS